MRQKFFYAFFSRLSISEKQHFYFKNFKNFEELDFMGDDFVSSKVFDLTDS
jgi:hypothetical protein